MKSPIILVCGVWRELNSQVQDVPLVVIRTPIVICVLYCLYLAIVLILWLIFTSAFPYFLLHEDTIDCRKQCLHYSKNCVETPKFPVFHVVILSNVSFNHRIVGFVVLCFCSVTNDHRIVRIFFFFRKKLSILFNVYKIDNFTISTLEVSLTWF